MATYKGGKLSDGTPLNVAVYQAYRNAGLSHNQSLAVTAEVGRENGFNSNVLFGGHVDPAANSGGGSIENLGMLSWNQDRGKSLASFLRQKGVMNGNSMAQTQANLNAQAQFSVGEMKSPRYAKGLKGFWSNPNANPDAYARELGKNYIAWAYGQDTIRAQGGGRKSFNWQSHDNRRRNYLNTTNGMLGGKNNYSQAQQPATDPRLSMSAPDLLATLRKGKDKRTDLQMLYELSNNNGLAGREIKTLLAQGNAIDDIASQLGLKVPRSQPQATEVDLQLPDVGNSYEEFMANIASQDEPDISMPDLGENYQDFMSKLQIDEPQQEQRFPDLGKGYEDFIANLDLGEQSQEATSWQTQKTLSDSTSNERNAKAPQMVKSSWESLS